MSAAPPLPPAIEAFAARVLDTPRAAMPEVAVAATKTFLLDTLGVGISGSTAPLADRVCAAAQGWGDGSAVGIWGRSLRLPATSAAYLLGFQIHCQEYDCVHDRAVVHPMATILSAMAAGVGRLKARGVIVSGSDFLIALALAVDVAAGLGIASRSPVRFFRPANAGGFGAVAGLARLHGFDAARLADAWGHQLGQVSGTMQAHIEGKPVLPLQVGANARAALCSIDLAESGVPAPQDSLEGPFGYLPLMEPDYDLGETLDAFAANGPWRIAEVSHKPYPTGRACQGGVSGLLRLMQTHGFGAQDIAQATLFAPPLIHRLVGRPAHDGMAANYARLCLQYCGAVALTYGIVDVEHFKPPFLTDPALIALGGRIALAADGNADPNALQPQRLEVRLRDGRIVDIDMQRVLGSPDNPLDRAAHLDKFRRNWRHAAKALDPEGCERMIAAVERLDSLDDCQQVFDHALA